jgi:chitodextrinase
MTPIRIALVTALLTLALPAAASAETFCVHSPADCAGSAQPTLQAALDAANANGAGADQIRIGAGTFDEPPAVNVLGNPVEIVGAGPGQTTLQSSTAPLGKVIDIREPGSVVSQLRVHYTGSVIATGIELAGDGQDVRVTNADPSVAFTGITLEGTADLADARVDVEAEPDLLSSALFVVQGADVDIDDVQLAAPKGINASGGDAVVDRARIHATQAVSASFGADVEVRDSEIRVRENSASIYTPSAFFVGGDGATYLQADRVTAYAEGSGAGAKGVWAQPNGGANSATVHLAGSVLHGFQVAISLLEDAGTTVTLTSDWCAYDLSSVGFLNSPTYTPGTHMVDLAGVDPQFRAAAGGDLRPLHNSPLVDAGNPAFQPAGTVFDVLRSQRLRNGVVDIGAHEYQRAAPQAEITASASAAATGAAIDFDASTSSDPDEEPLTYAWSFDDGATATGAQVQHAFATPGQHTATVTVTDPSGLSASAAVAVDVTAPAGSSVPPPGGGQPGTGSPGSGGDQPGAKARLSGLRLSPARFRSRGAKRGKPPLGTTLSYRLSAAARVSFTIERAQQGRRVKGGCRTQTRANRARRSCTRWILVGRFGADGKAGANTVRFAGKVGAKPLVPGRYRIRAQIPGSQPTAAKRFRVVRAPASRP